MVDEVISLVDRKRFLLILRCIFGFLRGLERRGEREGKEKENVERMRSPLDRNHLDHKKASSILQSVPISGYIWM